MNDDFLTRYRQAPRPAFAAALYDRITQPMSPLPASRAARRAAWALAGAAALVIISLLAVPPLRARAATLLRQIGVISFTDAERTLPAAASTPRGLPDPTSTPIPPDRPATLTTLDQVSAEAGFEPRLPGFVPEGYELTEFYAMEYLDDAGRGEGMGIALVYRQTAEPSHYLDVQQTRFAGSHPREWPVGQNAVVDVTVNGRPGVWLEQAALDAPDDPQPERRNMLVWEGEGFIHTLLSDSLPLKTMLQVAESLGD